ncbi:helix-turn-helix domain-containing protein [Streptomyces sp. NPDC004528]|uniref:winged helix-turn-helix transcriptional regulator n=1 Tax=Streptomyces sp. NPDC004528 TaxID=3154550 RepID=UPI0033ACD2F8
MQEPSPQPSADGVITRVGRFVQRVQNDETGCRMERALEVVGTRSALILLREVYYGSRRFDDLVLHTGLTEAVTSQRLKRLVASGLLQRQPYREQGQRTRYEYVLTEMGRDFFPVFVAFMEWGARLGDDDGVELAHDGCGSPLRAVVQCLDGHSVSLSETVARFSSDRTEGVQSA